MPSGRSAYDLIVGSLRLINAISVGETPTADEANDALDSLNDLIESWSTESLSIIGSDDVTYNLVPAQSSYAIGPVLTDFVGPRPIRINSAYVTLNGYDFPPLEIVGLDQFNAIALKTTQGDIPNYLCYINSVPNGTIRLWPVPNVTPTLTMNTDVAITAVSSTSMQLVLPPGMWVAMQYSLSLMLWPSYNGANPAPQTIVSAANLFKKNFKRANKKQLVQQFDPALSGITYYDWRQGS